eukprot:SAG11_NODE_27166_length_336_cov_0.603376_1_plen_42_part_01
MAVVQRKQIVATLTYNPCAKPAPERALARAAASSPSTCYRCA